MEVAIRTWKDSIASLFSNFFKPNSSSNVLKFSTFLDFLTTCCLRILIWSLFFFIAKSSIGQDIHDGFSDKCTGSGKADPLEQKLEVTEVESVSVNVLLMVASTFHIERFSSDEDVSARFNELKPILSRRGRFLCGIYTTTLVLKNMKCDLYNKKPEVIVMALLLELVSFSLD